MPKVVKRSSRPAPAPDDARWFRLIAETASDLISVLDTRGRRVYANPALQELLGQQCVGAGSDAFLDIHAEDRAAVRARFAEIARGGEARRAEYRLLLPGGEMRRLEAQGNAVLGPGGRVELVLVVARDVTERRRMEDVLRARDVQLQEAQAIANLGSWEWDIPGNRIWWSDQLRRIFGLDDSYQPTLASFIEAVHADERATIAEASRIAFEQGRVYDKPFRIVRPDGAVRTVITSGRLERDADGQPARLLGILVDVTDKTWIERRARSVADRLRSVSRRLVEVQEAERRLLARELHDRVGQSLTALGLNLRVVSAELSQDSRRAVQARMEDCMRLVEDTVGAMRDVMGELRPQALDDYGLLAALRSHVTSFSARTGIHVTVEGAEKQGRLPRNAELALFRIAQEALNNVAKHSRATAVRVSFDGAEAQAVLALSDDGVGFDPQGSGAEAGWGLMIMRERATSIGARFELNAAPGRGVRIAVHCAP